VKVDRSTRPLAVLFVLVGLCAAGSPARAGFDPDRVHALITQAANNAVAAPDFPGISIAVLRKGDDIPITAAAGTACVENATPMTPAARFKIGSVTKVFTATLIHRLIEQGKLDYETPISRFFPAFPNGANITVRNLLEHTSGIAEMLALPAVRANMAKSWTPEEIISLAGKESSLFRPGERQAYCNTGFLMLAVISERVSGKGYAALVRETFTEGLGMASLLQGDDTTVVPRLSCGYTGNAGGLMLPMAASLAAAKGTGDLEAAPADVVRLVNLDRVLKNDVLSTVPLEPLVLRNGTPALKQSRDGNSSTSELDGCTLFLFKSPAMALVGKPGSFPGFGTVYFFDRQTGIAAVVSVNNEAAIGRAITLAARILHDLRRQQDAQTALTGTRD
jgi:CubicO group peptidase (beta-lactamase class C family)